MEPTAQSLKRAASLPLFSAALLGAFVAAAVIFEPGASAWLPSCPLHHFTGLYCPGCGSTRMIHQLFRGHVATAFAQNPLAFVMLPVVLVGLFRQISGQPAIANPETRRRWGTVLLIVVIAFGAARNIPMRPFSYLAPGGLAKTD